jgi:hypothetical protein
VNNVGWLRCATLGIQQALDVCHMGAKTFFLSLDFFDSEWHAMQEKQLQF